MAKIDVTVQVALITGAGGALGRSYALELASRGVAVGVNDLDGNTRGAGGLEEHQRRGFPLRSGVHLRRQRISLTARQHRRPIAYTAPLSGLEEMDHVIAASISGSFANDPPPRMLAARSGQ